MSEKPTTGILTKTLAPNHRQLLPGTWILVKIETPDSIDIVHRSVAMQGIKISSKETAILSYERVSLQDYLARQLKLNVTKFSFHGDNSFEFFRDTTLTYSGKWELNRKELIFEYFSGQNKNEKINKLLKLNEKELGIESESHNKPVTFYFVRQ